MNFQLDASDMSSTSTPYGDPNWGNWNTQYPQTSTNPNLNPFYGYNTQTYNNNAALEAKVDQLITLMEVMTERLSELVDVLTT